MFIKTDETAHVVLAMNRVVELPDGSQLIQNVEGMTEVELDVIPENIHDYKLENGKLILDEELVAKREAEATYNAEIQRRINELPSDIADIQDALVEIAEMVSELVGE